jgi:hypothetical protein
MGSPDNLLKRRTRRLQKMSVIRHHKLRGNTGSKRYGMYFEIHGTGKGHNFENVPAFATLNGKLISYCAIFLLLMPCTVYSSWLLKSDLGLSVGSGNCFRLLRIQSELILTGYKGLFKNISILYNFRENVPTFTSYEV